MIRGSSSALYTHVIYSTADTADGLTKQKCVICAKHLPVFRFGGRIYFITLSHLLRWVGTRGLY
jgi:hypothetical protein